MHIIFPKARVFRQLANDLELACFCSKEEGGWGGGLLASLWFRPTVGVRQNKHKVSADGRFEKLSDVGRKKWAKRYME